MKQRWSSAQTVCQKTSVFWEVYKSRGPNSRHRIGFYNLFVSVSGSGERDDWDNSKHATCLMLWISRVGLDAIILHTTPVVNKMLSHQKQPVQQSQTTNGGDGRFGAPWQSTVSTSRIPNGETFPQIAGGIVPESSLLYIEATSFIYYINHPGKWEIHAFSFYKSRFLTIFYLPSDLSAPNSLGIVPVILLFSIWKNDSRVSCEIEGLIDPPSSLSLRSSCWRLFRLYNSSGMDPLRRLKFRSICSRLEMEPSSGGIVPVKTPSSSSKNRRAESSWISYGSVPAIPFCSEKGRRESCC